MNEIRLGHALSELRQLDTDSVHIIVTSPPYWGQRDYGNDDGIGTEDTVTEYVRSLRDVFHECQRVLRDDGSLVVNIADTYERKERRLIPFALARELQNGGWVCRQDLVWHKSGTKPDPATDRRSRDHEYVFHFVQQRDYWYDGSVADGEHTSVIEAPTANSNLDHTAVYSEPFVESVLDGLAPPTVCAACETPYERSYDRVPRPFADPERDQAQRAREKIESSTLTEDHIEAVQSAGISDVGKAVQTEDGANENTDDVLELAREAKEVLGGYYREFTMVKRVPTAWTKCCSCSTDETVGGVVCDPFIGSGTTAAVARRQGLRYLGVDINDKFVNIARERVSEVSR